jgi:type IV secretory pathway protease TraF
MLAYFVAFCNQYPARVFHSRRPPRMVFPTRCLRPLRLGRAWCGCCADSALLWHTCGSPLFLTYTASVPPGVYAMTPAATVTRGMLGVFPLSATVAALVVTRGGVAPHKPLLKLVAALPSETVCVQVDGGFIQGDCVPLVAPGGYRDSSLLRWCGCVTLRTDEVFPLRKCPIRVGSCLKSASTYT